MQRRFLGTRRRGCQGKSQQSVGVLFRDVNAQTMDKTTARVAPVPRTGAALIVGHPPRCIQPSLIYQIPYFLFFFQFPGFGDGAVAQQLHQKQKQVVQAVSQVLRLFLAMQSSNLSISQEGLASLKPPKSGTSDTTAIRRREKM